jgi:hypothetical protein
MKQHQKEFLCNQCCTPYKNEKQAKMCEKRCGKHKSCDVAITIRDINANIN